MYDPHYETKREAAHTIYMARPLIYSPFFKAKVFLSPEGFQHLCVSAHGERDRDEQIRRFILLPLGLRILETATTLRSYQRRLGSKGRKTIQWWSFVEHFRKQGITVGVVIRKVGNGKLHFWSVMLYT
jgi:hypothetical protein